MYSVVLMMALSTGSVEAPAHCWGCNSCCSGWGCCSCSCSGCWGCSSCCSSKGCCSGCFGGFRLFGGKSCCSSSCCHGCCSYSCCHGGYYGCCNGCCGGYYGCCGGYAGCCNGGYYGCCNGGYYGCGGGYYGCAPAAPVAPVAPPAPPVAPPVKPEDKKTSIDAPATIVVDLPADAKLLIDDAATTQTSANRVFTSPTLEAGKEFHYTLKAEIVRDGKTLTVSEYVSVRAGEETRVSIPTTKFATAAVASK